MPRALILAAAAAALVLAPAGGGAWADWDVGEDGDGALVRSGDSSLLYLCDEEKRVLQILSPMRVPTVGSIARGWYRTDARIDGRGMDATLFYIAGDTSVPLYLYSVVLKVKGDETTLSDALAALSRGRVLEIDMWGTQRLRFSLADASRAIAYVERRCK